MSQIDAIFNVLVNNTEIPGITPTQLAKKSRVPVENVYKRIHDLRNEGLTIYLNTRKVKGRTQTFYRLAA